MRFLGGGEWIRGDGVGLRLFDIQGRGGIGDISGWEGLFRFVDTALFAISLQLKPVILDLNRYFEGGGENHFEKLFSLFFFLFLSRIF